MRYLVLFLISSIWANEANQTPLYKQRLVKKIYDISINQEKVCFTFKEQMERPKCLKVGESILNDISKHSNTTYTLFEINNSNIKINYQSKFDARSFGKGVSNSSGDFEIKVSNLLVVEKQECSVSAQCREVNCKTYDNPVKNGYKPDCVPKAGFANETKFICKCMCYGCH